MTDIELPLELVIPADRRFLSREPASPEMLDCVGVDKKWAQYVRVLDRQGPLVLLHYLTTLSDSGINEEPMKEIGKIRGTIIDTETNSIVCRSFPYTPEVMSNDSAKISELIPQNLFDVQLYNACEGTVLRLFWSNGWMVSTHRKIDANNSYWSGPTFGSMFEEIKTNKNVDLDALNQELCYIFLMSHDSNRLIYRIPDPQLMLIAIYNRPEQRFFSAAELETAKPSGCSLPSQICCISSLGELQEKVETMGQHAAYNQAGIIAIADHTDPRPVKIINPTYNALRDIRGNDPSLRTRYIQLRGMPECGVMLGLFNDPEHREIFDSAESEIDILVERLHWMYINRYIKKNFSQLPKEEFVTLQRCHSWHTADRLNNIVTKFLVREFLNTTPAHYLLIMLNRQRKLLLQED